ncbi:hypothetical protein K456DRAFT_1887997 [Colletotrichum gloeosporioides 23]|nr:hypothetical protein K456DRAFT_1887997 [Colletotrichum gloeosporioides 23]
MPLSDGMAERNTGRRYSRKPHSKTTTGCLQCRHRRVKCTEERPACRACVRRNALCEYVEDRRRPGRAATSSSSVSAPSHTSGAPGLSRLQSSSNHDPATPHSEHLSSSAATPATVSSLIRAPIANAPSFGINDLALLHHWTVSTSIDIFKSAPVDSLWQVTFPRIGFEHPFVAHAILSLAALHLAYISATQNSPYVVEATKHHEEAIKGFQDASNNINNENSEALLAWSLLNIIYVFSISKQLPDQDKRTAARLRRDRVLGMEWIPMARGINAVLVPTYQYLKDGPMSSLITLGNWNELDPGDSLPEPVDAQLCRLKETWANNNDAKTYDEALHILRKCRMYVLQFKSMNPQTLAQWGFNRDWAGPLTFIHFVPQEYVSLLHQRQPPALVLFAYFGAFMHALDDYWFFEGWGKDIVEVVDDLLGSYWRSWITWPIEYVGLS